MLTFTITDDTSRVRCPMCGQKVGIDRAQRRLHPHKKGSVGSYTCPAVREEVAFIVSAKKKTIVPPETRKKRKPRRSTSESADDKHEAAARRYHQRITHMATRGQRYADRDFAIWADDSFGSEDIDTSGSASVRTANGGRVQSNRSRY